MKLALILGCCVISVMGSPSLIAQDAQSAGLVQVETTVHNDDGRVMGRFMQASPHHGDGVISVTTDSPEYCAQLVSNVDAIIAEPHGVLVGAMEDARRLRAHGVKLCQNGHLRAGIERLRRALVLLEHSQDHS
nr:hypothetical protein [uncultured Neokomagataea sp.]